MHMDVVSEPDPEDFRDLFLGEYGESAEQRAAREAAARDVLAELLIESGTDAFALMNAVYAVRLSTTVVPLRRPAGTAPAGRAKSAWARSAA
ncbi:hypothetical protein ACWCXE_02325 [Streptomyces sp. NPDC001780]